MIFFKNEVKINDKHALEIVENLRSKNFTLRTILCLPQKHANNDKPPVFKWVQMLGILTLHRW